MKPAIERFRASLPFTYNLAAKAAVVAADGRVLETTAPGASASIARSVAAVREFFGERWASGDVAVLNDPDRGATHVCQLTAIAPLFRNGKITQWGVMRANLPDMGGWHTGGYSPQAVDRWAEGARFEPAKLLLGGRVRREVADLLSLNSRTPVATRRLALALAEGALKLGAADESTYAAELATSLAGRDGAGKAAVRTPTGIASPGDISVRISGGSKLKVEVTAPAVSAHPINLGAAASSDIVLSAVIEALNLEPKTGALLELLDIRLGQGMLSARVPACVGIGRETSGAALHAACTQALSSKDTEAWLARETAGRLDWATGQLDGRSQAALLAAEMEASR